MFIEAANLTYICVYTIHYTVDTLSLYIYTYILLPLKGVYWRFETVFFEKVNKTRKMDFTFYSNSIIF